MATKVINSNPLRLQPLSIAKGAAKNRTNDFLAIKTKINLIKDPSQR